MMLQQINAGRVWAEYVRRLKARGYVFGEGAACDELTPPAGADPNEPMRILVEVTREFFPTVKSLSVEK